MDDVDDRPDARTRRLFVGVIAFEVVVVLALWWLGRYFG
jgi:hypothetical protein